MLKSRIERVREIAGEARGLRARAETTPISGAALLKALGVYNGISSVYFAFMTKEDTADAMAEYDTPVLGSEAIEIGLTPEYASGTLNASDNVIRNSSLVTSYGVKLNAARLTPAFRGKLLGRAMTAEGLEIVGDSTEGPYVAMGYMANRDDGTKQMRWLYKGRFKEMAVTDRTRERGSIAYVTPVLEATFVPLDCEITVGGKKLRPILIEGDTSAGGTAMTPEEFFASVQKHEEAAV